MNTATTTTFIERTRARRVAGGKPEKITNSAVYGLLDGLLAKSQEVAA